MNPISTVVPAALAELLRRGPVSQAKLEFAWRAAVGDALTRATTIKLGANGLVMVHTADARWRHELTRTSPIILNKLAALLGPGVVTRLVVT